MQRKIMTTRTNTVALSLALMAASLLPLGQTSSARADDRNLFGTSSTAPYLFILLDTTGSMQWKPEADDTYCAGSTVGGGSIGLSDPLCTGARIDDDPESRMYQAKDALYGVLEDTEQVSFGFATFPETGDLRIRSRDTVGGLPFAGQTSPFADGTVGDEGNACDGLELNGDESVDEWTTDYNLRQDDGTTASGLTTGDLVPLDWDNNNRLRIQQRLAPNLIGDPAATPDFGIATYFGSSTVSKGGENVFPLLSNAERPIFAKGGTPLDSALRDFKTWFDDWEDDAADPTSPGDPSFADGCREVSTILVTDGVETCGGDPVDAAGDLWNPGGTARKIKTYVIGFATDNPNLDNIAMAGGSPIHDCDGDGVDDPGCYAYLADDKDELIEAFSSIVGDVQGSARTFATGAVPSVIGGAGDVIYLSSFSPISPLDDSTALWPGQLDAYKKPVPLVNVGGSNVPNSDMVCADPDTDDSCLAWRAAEELLDQAPDATLVETDLRIGLGATKRRVYWGRKSSNRVPENRFYLNFQPTEGRQNALYGPQGFDFTIPTPTSPPDPPEDRTGFISSGEEVIKYFLKKKQATIVHPITLAPDNIDYVMGDVFHSDPVIVGEPNRSDYFAKDLEGEIEPCGTTNTDKSRYPCFVKDQIGRRRVLLVGSNEGAVHAFDAGSAYRNADGFLEYTAGNGQELFAYVPRAVMPDIRDMKENGGQRFTVDGPLVVDDVLRDRFFHKVSDPLDPTQREWSTVAIGGLREGGRSYYALDVTQPDTIDATTNLPIPNAARAGCANGGATCDTRYPESLWEFTDDWDEDNNRTSDLGHTWSKPNTGRIRYTDGVDTDGNPIIKDMYVAIFGGGLDAEFKRNPVANPVAGGGQYRYSGNYLYMVNIETGQMIYKRRIDKTNYFSATTTPSMAPSEPAAVDTDQDSYLDTIYIGTTAGYMYKVDISEPVDVVENHPVDNWKKLDPVTGNRPRVENIDRIIDPKWDPFPIFSTGGRPIYYPPSVIFVPELARFAIAFGVGDREDLWAPRYSADPLDGRFYVVLDDGLAPDPMDTLALPLDESDLEGFIATDTAAGDSTADLLASPNSPYVGGFHLKLVNKERLIAKSFGLSGVLFFSTYIPETTPAGVGLSCGSAGKSRLYSIFTTNGVGIRTSAERYREVDDFVTSPFVESDGASGDLPDDPDAAPEGSQACSDDELQAIRTSLMSKLPPECNFAQYSVNVMTLQSHSGLECIVPIPVCVVQRNWKEF